jgi:hypothetical protein
MEAHNLKRLLDLGVCVTVNSDDPAYFGGYLLENYLAVQQALDLSKADLALLARNSIEASFLAAIRAAPLDGCGCFSHRSELPRTIPSQICSACCDAAIGAARIVKSTLRVE